MSKSTKGYQDMINSIVYERLTGEIPESFSNEWMQRGIELEPEARRSFEFETFQKVKQIGFVEFDEWIGCSPDGIIGDDGLLQIKCPKYNTLINYHVSGKIGRDYEMQLQGEMFVTGRKHNIFYAWHPKLKSFRLKVARDEDAIKKIRDELAIAIITAKERISIF